MQDTTTSSAGSRVTRELRIRGLAYLLTFNWLSVAVSPLRLPVDCDACTPEQGVAYVAPASTQRLDSSVAFDPLSRKNHTHVVYRPLPPERRSIPPDFNATVCAMGKGGNGRYASPGRADWKGKASGKSGGKSKKVVHVRERRPPSVAPHLVDHWAVPKLVKIELA